jgi:hypothetical protein
MCVAPRLFALVAVVGVLLGAAAAQPQCTNTINGKNYDISQLQGLPQKLKVNSYDVSYTPCVSSTCSSDSGVSVCLLFSGSTFGWSIGDMATAQWLPSARNDEGFQLTFSAENGRITSKIDFLCDPSFASPGILEPGPNGAEPIFDQYHFQWKSVYACPLKKGSSGGGGGGLAGGWIFIIVLCCVLFVYFVGGFIFLRFYRKEEGIQNQIPQYSFWVSIPGLVKDGCVFTYQKTTGLLRRTEYLG